MARSPPRRLRVILLAFTIAVPGMALPAIVPTVSGLPRRRTPQQAKRLFFSLPAVGVTAGCLLIALSLLVLRGSEAPSTRAQEEECQPGDKGTYKDEQIEAELDSAGEILADCIIVEGNLDLAGEAIAGPIVLTRSRFEGRLTASFTTLSGSINFSKSHFVSPVFFAGAVLKSDVRLSGVTFESRFVAFDARFERRLDASGANFVGSVDLSSAVFAEDAVMEGATFAEVADFERADFQEEAFFSTATFKRDTKFVGASAASNLDFRGTVFNGNTYFSEVVAADKLDLDGSHFWPAREEESELPDPSCPCTLTFEKATAGEISLNEANFDRDRGSLNMSDVSFGAIEMDLSLIGEIVEGRDPLEDPKEDKIAVLKLVESTARDRGETDKANDAAFEREVLSRRDNGWPSKTFWWIAGEQIGGYLVKPLRPFFAMVGVALAAAVMRLTARYLKKKGGTSFKGAIRFLKRILRKPQTAKSEIDAVLSVGNFRWWVAQMVASFWAAVSVAGTPKTPQVKIDIDKLEGETPAHIAGAAGLWAEWICQKGLNAVLVISLGNAVPGFKEIVDAVFSK